MSKSERPENHSWKTGSAPPLIRPHSEAKHRVIRSYLERYVEVLTANPAQEQLKLTLVDGFAGGGIYLSERGRERRLGSPLLMLEAMKAARELAQSKRTKPFNLDVDYYFIEQDHDAHQHLRKTLAASEFAGLVDSRVRVIHGSFLDHIRPIVAEIKKPRQACRAIFVLDQFGYADVPLPSIRMILSELGNAEVVLTFAVDCLINYLNDDEGKRAQLERIGLSLPTKADAVARDGDQWRRVIQYSLHKQIPGASGADFYTPFFIRSDSSGRDFWLIHLSGHHRARDVMVGLHWDQSTDFSHYGGAGYDMLGYNQSNDPSWTLQNAFPAFQFDAAAKESSQIALLSQLPELLSRHCGGITFDQFFAGTTNATPVTSEIMKGVLDRLSAEGELVIRDKDGVRRKTGRIGRKDDVLFPNPQLRLPFM